MPVSGATKKKSPEDNEKDRVGKYASYFKENTILPIPELVAETVPMILSFIVTDLKTRKLSGLKKTFWELLGTAGIPGRYCCGRNFTTWDAPLSSEELAVKLTRNNISTKYFRLQLEYWGKRRIRVTVCNVPIHLNGDVLAA